jgi:hypothetical protein
MMENSRRHKREAGHKPREQPLENKLTDGTSSRAKPQSRHRQVVSALPFRCHCGGRSGAFEGVRPVFGIHLSASKHLGP